MNDAKVSLKISPRLNYLFQQLQPGSEVWDLACDHGLVGMRAVLSGQFPAVTFVDKSVDAVNAMKEDFEVKLGFAEHKSKVNILTADMLNVELPENNVSFVVAGVGAHLICRFIRRVRPEEGTRLVLGPNKNPRDVEKALIDSGWNVLCQRVIIERGRERTVFTATGGREVGA
ncbi:MAG: tRNA (adenine(22)-N(1))-methyltransferase TrmK [Bdellovibrionales bacterium]|nr:tRNA (adenine(22)-N(1))-methyltransferase TrmK [Bdellovibrionales bacterium]